MLKACNFAITARKTSELIISAWASTACRKHRVHYVRFKLQLLWMRNQVMAASVEHGLNNSAFIPPLESGDRLTRHEFERRYTAMPHIKAELIEGVVYVASPLRFRSHGQPHGQLITWLGVYQVSTPGVALGDNATVRLDLDNEPQPDVLLLIDKPTRGQAQISEDDYVEGAPELVAEIAASSASIDLYDKKRAYRRNGVQEYIVWQTLDSKLDWFCLQNGEYLPLVADADGVVKSRVFPGLWLAVTSLITGNMTKVLAVLQQGLNSQEHTEFVEHLA